MSHPNEPNARRIRQIVTAHSQREGAGFIVRRPLPTAGLELLDPFLLIDEMGPVEHAPGKAIGAPDHPHRGFETVSYILAGESEHEDSAGHAGRIGPGDVQWMTAGAGIIHSEMPSRRFQETGGTLHGFQIWVNLPARDKMMAPRYQEVPSAKIPEAATQDGLATVRVIAGTALGVSAVIDTRTPIIYHHWELAPGARVSQPLPPDHNVGVYVFDGELALGPDRRVVQAGQLAVLGQGDALHMRTEDATASLLVLGGVPLRETVARHGPFVMNTKDELATAFEDYRAGRLGRIHRGDDPQ